MSKKKTFDVTQSINTHLNTTIRPAMYNQTNSYVIKL